MSYRFSSRFVVPKWAHLFIGVLRRSPARALAIAFFYVKRQRVRAHNRLQEAAIELLPPYQTWVRTIERIELETLRVSQREVKYGRRASFSLLVHAPAWTGVAALNRTLASIDAQICKDWELILTGPLPFGIVVEGLPSKHLEAAGPDRTGALRPALAAAVGDFIIILPPDVVLPSSALARYQEAAFDATEVSIFYGDEDVIDIADRRTRPWFKPQWNAELILALDYVSHAYAIAAPVARAASEISPDLADCVGYALLLAAVSRADVSVRHIAHVLCHLPDTIEYNDSNARLRAVSRHIATDGGHAELGPFETVRVRWPLPDTPPPVTIIIPTRDKVELMKVCIGSLLCNTIYPKYDIIIVDNGSVEQKTHDWFEHISNDSRVSILKYDYPYNYSAINNFAEYHADGKYICLLNNDTEIIEGAWLNELMRYAVRPNVGAVGPKLLYGDGSIQHAGVVIGLGGAAGHAHRGLPDQQPGYFAQAHCAHYASAVTAACLVVERAKFEAVGGLDATDLQIAYNDVDFCLKLGQKGWSSVYAPQAVMIHHESKSRGQDMSPLHIERYKRELAILRSRWNTSSTVDPMHHLHLDRTSETYRIQLWSA